ncbi:MAG TPA: hypothetical protein VGH20_07425 [Myxococcales bacterium]|jgi:hypothetical protein
MRRPTNGVALISILAWIALTCCASIGKLRHAEDANDQDQIGELAIRAVLGTDRSGKGTFACLSIDGGDVSDAFLARFADLSAPQMKHDSDCSWWGGSIVFRRGAFDRVPAWRIDVSGIVISGNTATADVSLVWGTLGGEYFKARFRRNGAGAWTLDARDLVEIEES